MDPSRAIHPRALVGIQCAHQFPTKTGSAQTRQCHRLHGSARSGIWAKPGLHIPHWRHWSQVLQTKLLGCWPPSYKRSIKILASDSDGTITDKDFTRGWPNLMLARIRLTISPCDERKRISHFGALAAYFGFAPTEEQRLEELLAASRAVPDLGVSVALLRRAGEWTNRPRFSTPSTSRTQ